MIWKKDSQTRRQQIIQRLSQEVADLSLQLNQLIIQENQEQEDSDQASKALEIKFLIRDQVEITNNYHGLQGTQGTVTHMTTHQVLLWIEGQQKVVTRKKSNIQKIE
jgi:acyl-CoA reductase-like NAD-dependent aldehyde dehydrogenase